jgi:predicted RNase H-like HicB family nuclease
MPAEKMEKTTSKQPKGVKEIHLKMYQDSSNKEKGMAAKKAEKIEKVTRKQPKTKGPAEKTLAQIFKEQRVKPFDSSENGKNWPKGADYQEFIDANHNGTRKLIFKVPIIVEFDSVNYHSYSPALKGLHMDGETEKQALDNARKTAKDFLEIMIQEGRPIPLSILTWEELFA